MNRILQGLLLSILIVSTILPAMAQKTRSSKPNSELQGDYKEPVINRQLFGDDLSMVNNEREDYATNLTAYAVQIVKSNKGSQASLDSARQLLGLALHLSPRNKPSVIVNRNLKDGILPKDVPADYDTAVFAKLLFARGQLLENQKGKSNALLSRYFIALAAVMDPRNEDAIYEAEMHRIDHGELSWAMMTDAPPKKLPAKVTIEP
jgi:hypothetical protein